MKALPFLTLAVSISTLIYLIRLKGFITVKNQELLDALNTATNNLATRIATWQASFDNLTPKQEAEGKAIVATLEGLATNADEPVPPPVEAEPV